MFQPLYSSAFLRYLLLSVTPQLGSACGVMVIVVGNGDGDTSSNPGRE